MRFVPRGNHVVVREHQDELLTRGGLHVPVAHARHSLEGTVIATGPGAYVKDEDGEYQWAPVGVARGEVVRFPPGAGHVISFDGVPHRVIREPDLQLVVG